MISIQDLSFSFRSNALFSGLDLVLESGGICGLLGKNGAGKTTLMKLIAGLLFPESGTLEVAGEQPSHRSPRFLQDLFFIPEVFELPRISAKKYVRLFAPFYPQFDPDKCAAHLQEFELDGDINLGKLSYGQRKKFLIAFGLAASCRLTLLDEPTNGLDIPSKSQFRRALAQGLTQDRLFIIATHQVRDLESLIDPVIILDNGRILFNQGLADISRRMTTVTLPSLPEPDDTLYSEQTLEGFKAVIKNREAEPGFMDLETLFITVLENREKVAGLFGKEAGHAA